MAGDVEGWEIGLAGKLQPYQVGYSHLAATQSIPCEAAARHRLLLCNLDLYPCMITITTISA